MTETTAPYPADMILGQVPVADITRRARNARPQVTLASVIGALFFAAGWGAYKLLSVAWFCVAWMGIAVASGWQTSAGKRATGPTYDELAQDNLRLRREVERLS